MLPSNPLPELKGIWVEMSTLFAPPFIIESSCSHCSTVMACNGIYLQITQIKSCFYSLVQHPEHVFRIMVTQYCSYDKSCSNASGTVFLVFLQLSAEFFICPSLYKTVCLNWTHPHRHVPVLVIPSLMCVNLIFCWKNILISYITAAEHKSLFDSQFKCIFRHHYAHFSWQGTWI